MKFFGRKPSDVVTGKLDVRGMAVPEFEAVEDAAASADDTDDAPLDEID